MPLSQFESLEYLYTLKKALKTYDLDPANNIKAKKVLNPPYNTAGPIYPKVLAALSVAEESQLGYTQFV